MEKSGDLIATVGSAVQDKLDETGVTENVAYYTNKAADSTLSLGQKVYEGGSNVVSGASSNEYVSDITNKSKSALGTVGGAVIGASYSLYSRFKTLLVEDDDEDERKKK